MTQHTGDTINKLTEAVERDEQRAYPGRAFPGVEDADDLQSMLDGLAAEHERGN